MIVEIVGSTGAGKTTLIAELQRRLAQTTEVATSFDVVATPLGLQGITHPTARNLIQEFVGLPFFVGSFPRHHAFVSFALKMLARQAKFTIFAINNLRSLERKIGVYEILRQYEHKRIVLVDEGTVLSAHNIFVYTNAGYAPEEISRFVSLIPLPDVIVYVRAPVETLIKRSLHRPDPPREMRSKDRALIEQYINRATALFEQLVEIEEIRNRVLIVDNPEGSDQDFDAAVNYVTAFILNCEPAGQYSNTSS